MQQLISAFITFFSGVAVIIAVVLIVYLSAYCVDRFVCLNSAAILTAEEIEERRNATGVTIQSGLAGLLSDERTSVFRAFFEKRSFPYYKEAEEVTVPDIDNADENDDLEAQRPKEAAKDQLADEDKGTPANSSETPSPEEAKAAVPSGQSGATCEDDVDAPTCSICLCEYDNGDKVILGNSCSHMFHFDCCMQWAEKGNEHCPYCREVMITAKDFLDTAVEVIGQERVTKLKKINEMAAARVAELAAAGERTIRSPVPPVGRAPTQTSQGRNLAPARTDAPAATPTEAEEASADTTSISSSPVAVLPNISDRQCPGQHNK